MLLNRIIIIIIIEEEEEEEETVVLACIVISYINKTDIIIRNNGKRTCLEHTLQFQEREVFSREKSKLLQYKDLKIETHRMLNVIKVISIEVGQQEPYQNNSENF